MRKIYRKIGEQWVACIRVDCAAYDHDKKNPMFQMARAEMVANAPDDHIIISAYDARCDGMVTIKVFFRSWFGDYQLTGYQLSLTAFLNALEKLDIYPEYVLAE